jgi:hypothetical protein
MDADAALAAWLADSVVNDDAAVAEAEKDRARPGFGTHGSL